jgi:hypothetical protein
VVGWLRRLDHHLGGEFHRRHDLVVRRLESAALRIAARVLWFDMPTEAKGPGIHMQKRCKHIIFDCNQGTNGDLMRFYAGLGQRRTSMTDFDREHDMRPGFGYSGAAAGNAPAWIIGIVVVALIVGVLGYSGHHSGTQSPATPSAVHEMTQPPPVSPAPAPEAPKP